MKKLSIIIITYNSEKDIERCLDSLWQNVKDIPHEIIVIDNNSPDHSADVVEQKYPHVRLIRNKDNAGFARGVNQGIIEATGEYILLLNPDTQLQPNALTRMQEFLESQSNAGAIGPQLEYMDGSLQSSFGRFPGLISEFIFSSGLYKYLPGGRVIKNRDQHTTPTEVDWITGACMMFTKEKALEAGNFDKDYWMYFEDIDFCKRLTKKGYANWYVPQARVRHTLSGSSHGSRSLLPIWFEARNLMLYTYKNLPAWQAELMRWIDMLKIRVQEKRFKKKDPVVSERYHKVFQKMKKMKKEDFLKTAAVEELKTL